jgi:hypothetical protein
VSDLGVGKRSALSEYPSQGRYGVGVASASLSAKTGPLAAGAVASASDRLLMVSEKGNSKVVFVRSLPKAGRATRGQELIAIRGRDKFANLLLLPPLEEETAQPASPQPASPKASAPRRPGVADKPGASRARRGRKSSPSPPAKGGATRSTKRGPTSSSKGGATPLTKGGATRSTKRGPTSSSKGGATPSTKGGPSPATRRKQRSTA